LAAGSQCLWGLRQRGLDVGAGSTAEGGRPGGAAGWPCGLWAMPKLANTAWGVVGMLRVGRRDVGGCGGSCGGAWRGGLEAGA
jgi:hypothetical protein